MASIHPDHLGFQLRELAERLDVRSFQALSPGIGLGELQPGERERPRRAPEREMPFVSEQPMPVLTPTQSLSQGVQAVPMMQVGRERRAVATAVAAPAAPQPEDRPKRSRVSFVGRAIRRTYCYTIDLALVVLSLGLAVASAAVALSLGDGTEEFWFEGGPLAWLLSFQVWQLAAMVGGVFLLYVVVFRLIAGRTFGESLALTPGKKYRSPS